MATSRPSASRISALLILATPALGLALPIAAYQVAAPIIGTTTTTRGF